MDTAFSCVDREVGFFSSDEKRWINRIHRLKESFPNDVQILAEPDENDGCIYCKVPADWLKIAPKKGYNRPEYTDEEKEKIAERLAKARMAKANKGQADAQG